MEKASYVISLKRAPVMKQMKGLETAILTGLYSEKITMVKNATFPGHSVLQHSHPYEQVDMVYSGKAILGIGDEKKNVTKGDFYGIPANVQHDDTCSGVEPFVVLDIYYPVCKDFIQKLSEQTTV